jgi:hypothetical protein
MVEESWTATGDPSVWNARYRYTKGLASVSAASTMRSWTLEEVFPLRVESTWGDFDLRPFSEGVAKNDRCRETVEGTVHARA